MKRLIIPLIFSSIFLGNIYSQKPAIAIHMNNPLALSIRAGGKIEYRTK